MEWIKGIKQLHTGNRILGGTLFDITAGDVGSTEEIQKRIQDVQNALEIAKNHFTEATE